jgi:hypothetical protein
MGPEFAEKRPPASHDDAKNASPERVCAPNSRGSRQDVPPIAGKQSLASDILPISPRFFPRRYLQPF